MLKLDHYRKTKTGVKFRGDFRLYTSDEKQNGALNFIEHASDGPLAAIAGAQPDPHAPTFLDAMHEQLGLKLEPARGSYPVLVIDHVEKPSEN